MRILLLGGGGFVGSALPGALAALGHEATTVHRSGDVRGDRNDPDQIARIAGQHKCDALIDLIAYEPAGTIALCNRLRDVIGRYVLISSADVYRNYGGLHRRENVKPIEASLSEDAPLRTQLYPYRTNPPRPADDPDAWQDQYDKIPIERALTDPHTTIVRLPMVYGPGDRNRRFRWIVSAMQTGDRLSAPRAWLDWRTTYGHIANVAHAIALCATHANAAGRAYNCGEPTSSHHEWAARFAAHLNWRGQIVEDEGSPIAKRIAALDLRFPLALDTTRIRAELGYSEPLSAEQTLASVIADEARRDANPAKAAP